MHYVTRTFAFSVHFYSLFSRKTTPWHTKDRFTGFASIVCSWPKDYRYGVKLYPINQSFITPLEFHNKIDFRYIAHANDSNVPARHKRKTNIRYKYFYSQWYKYFYSQRLGYQFHYLWHNTISMYTSFKNPALQCLISNNVTCIIMHWPVQIQIVFFSFQWSWS